MLIINIIANYFFKKTSVSSKKYVILQNKIFEEVDCSIEIASSFEKYLHGQESFFEAFAQEKHFFKLEYVFGNFLSSFNESYIFPFSANLIPEAFSQENCELTLTSLGSLCFEQ